MGRLQVAGVCAVVVVALPVLVTPVVAASDATGGGLLGVSVLASEVGSRLPVPMLTDLIAHAGLKLVVIDWAWVTQQWGATDSGAVNALIASLSSRQVRVAAMYRPRFLGKATVATQVTADGKPALTHGAEICYSDAEAPKWGIDWGLKILDKRLLAGQ